MNVLLDDPIKALSLPRTPFLSLSNAAGVNGKRRWKLKNHKNVNLCAKSCTHLSYFWLVMGKQRIFIAEIYLASIAVRKEITINFLELFDGEVARGAIFEESFVPFLYLGICCR